MKKRILLAEFKHETNSFSVAKTDMDSFQSRYVVEGDELISFFKATKTEVGGFIAACESEGLAAVPAIAANAMPGGRVTRAAFDFIQDFLIKAMRENPVDGILLSLHGAMALEDEDDGEGELLSSLRDIAGTIPIISTLDLHANLTMRMIQAADILIGYDTYPHIDTYERGYEAGEKMGALLRREIKPVMKLRQIPILCPALTTEEKPAATYLDLVHRWEQRQNVICASLFHGCFHADIADAVMSVVAVADGDGCLADAILSDIGDAVMKNRFAFRKEMTPLEEAVRRGINAAAGPVLLADVSDNPGGGSSADGTHVLRKLIDMGARNAAFAIIADKETVSQAIEAGVGSTIRVRLGGKTEPINGQPIEAVAVVKTIADGLYRNKGPMRKGLLMNLGRTVVLDIEDIEVIVSERRVQPMDPEVFRRVGIEPLDKKIIVVKSAMHFKAAFEPLAKEIVYVDAPGLASENPCNFPFSRIGKTVFPLDQCSGQTGEGRAQTEPLHDN